jgi:hypothetical protein
MFLWAVAAALDDWHRRMTSAVENADANGTHDEQALSGDTRVVSARRELGAQHSRRRDAVQAELDKVAAPAPAPVPVARDKLRKEREAVAVRGSIRSQDGGEGGNRRAHVELVRGGEGARD